MTNKSQFPIIYKVKTNNLDLIEAVPNRGIVDSKTAVSLLVTDKKKNQSHRAKLQVSYSELKMS